MAALFASCKKTYTCECYTTFTYELTGSSFYTLVIPGSKEAYSEKLSEKKARAACSAEQAGTESSVRNAMTDNGTYPLRSGESITSSCGLK